LVEVTFFLQNYGWLSGGHYDMREEGLRATGRVRWLAGQYFGVFAFDL
jgi:hypothetical protein